MDYNWITPRIALGAAPTNHYDANELQVQGVTHVVNMCLGHDNKPFFKHTTIELVYFGMLDGEDEHGLQQISAAIRYITNALANNHDHKIYLHCAAGISRSAAVMTGVLMQQQQLSLKQALTMVRLGRPVVNPHPAHLSNLLKISRKDQTAR
ncbi:MAG: dual specificity protein phosphatase family protein [Cyanobacteria bacterium NC_groundwater_1444_Ag_S-0.65um_54_12]|nr:dual specificity protein phosphatase family protein [Cyanobacteria bacterium NC_groundwater_1444_Ag_S-0.65um_54_12]